MLDVLLAKIIGRHLAVLGTLGCQAGKGELVADLARKQIRQCLSEMRMTGAEPDKIRQIFDILEAETDKNCRLRGSEFFWILAMAKQYVNFLLAVEEGYQAGHGCKRRTGHDFGPD